MTRWTRCGIYSPRSNSTAITVKKNRSNQWSILSSGRYQSTQFIPVVPKCHKTPSLLRVHAPCPPIPRSRYPCPCSIYWGP